MCTRASVLACVCIQASVSVFTCEGEEPELGWEGHKPWLSRL